MKYANQSVVIILIAISANLKLSAQSIAPPWMAHSDHLLYVLYQVREAQITQFMPEQTNPKVDENGLVTLGLEFYNVDKSFGQPLGQISFIFVEVQDYTSKSGTPGHLPIWGAVENEGSKKAWKEYFGFPYETIDSMKQTKNEMLFSGNIGDSEREYLKYSGKSSDIEFYYMQSDVAMIGIDEKGSFLPSYVPFVNKGRIFEPDVFEINDHGHPIWEILQKLDPTLIYLVEDAHFSYSPLMSK